MKSITSPAIMPPTASRQQHRSALSKQAGFTLIEILVVLAVLAAIAVTQIPIAEREANNLVVKAAANDIQRIQRASLRYYRHYGSWPSDVQTMVDAELLFDDEVRGIFSNNYRLTLAKNNLVLATRIAREDVARRVASLLPRGKYAAGVLTTVIDRPGEEPMHDALYSLDGSKPLEGDLDANHFDLHNVQELTSVNGYFSHQVEANNVEARNTVNAREIRASATVYSNVLLAKRQLVLADSVGAGARCYYLGSISRDRTGRLLSCVGNPATFWFGNWQYVGAK